MSSIHTTRHMILRGPGDDETHGFLYQFFKRDESVLIKKNGLLAQGWMFLTLSHCFSIIRFVVSRGLVTLSPGYLTDSNYAVSIHWIVSFCVLMSLSSERHSGHRRWRISLISWMQRKYCSVRNNCIEMYLEFRMTSHGTICIWSHDSVECLSRSIHSFVFATCCTPAMDTSESRTMKARRDGEPSITFLCYHSF